jgi:hypothetical protein
MKKPKRPLLSIIDAVRDPAIFGSWFKDGTTWSAWFVVLKAIFDLPMSDDELAVFRKHTGRTTPAPGGYLDCTLVIGRRGGKSLIMALIAAYLAAFFDWRPFLTGGEVGTIIIVAADKKQAAVTLGYLREMLTIPLLAGMVVRETAEVLELNTGITIEVVTANFKTIRGRTVCCAIADELAFWETDESGASPDSAIIGAVKPAMATVPGARLLKASSPYARRGVLWNDYRKHFGRDDSRTLVWQGSTSDMNPSVPADFIRDSYEDDPISAAAELGAAFRTDVESFVSREVVEACVVRGRYELPPIAGATYYGFCDPSGGSSDSMTLCVAHRENDRSVIDVIREVPPPFSPEETVADFAKLLKAYRISTVTSDRYAGQWVAERYRAHGVQCNQAAKPKSDLYKDMLPVLNSGTVELLDHAKAISQICSLERRTARGGRDSIDHAPRARDDLANAIAGAVVGTAISQGGPAGWIEYYRRISEKATPASGSDRVRVHVPAELAISTVYGISGTAYGIEIGSDGRRTVMMSRDDAKALVCSPIPSSSWREVNPEL